MNLSRRRLFQTGLAGSLASMLPVSAASVGASSPVRARGIIFMVSDGMSSGVLPMSEAFSQQLRKRPTAWWQLLSGPATVHGLMDTASSDSLVTDSAAASSAWSSGQRIPNSQVNISDKGRELESIGATLRTQNVRLGLVTTSKVTHATPAGFAANSVDRNDEDHIAPQYLDRAELVLGGGSKFFDAAKRGDRRDLFAEYRKAGYEVLRHRDELLASNSPKLLGTFASDHLPYSIDRAADPKLAKKVPTLAEMTRAALDRFLASDKPFLLQVEGARIDHAAHANDIGALLHDQLAFDDALAEVIAMTAAHPEILVVITSDHGNANPALNGTGAAYRRTNEHFERIARARASHEAILASWKSKPGDTSDLVALIEKSLGFTPEKEEASALLDTLAGREFAEWSHQLSNPPGLLGQISGNHTGTGWTGVSHTADPTVISSFGPGSAAFSGLVRNDQVRDKLLETLGV
ncbi:alkaline phosphatase [Haloferula chungangensis]|uniref:Alkaline phosphatase n=1 Tax=Haloferula chungangensis TaxID=1048331 RepID=A0ABW2LC65_9BACT